MKTTQNEDGTFTIKREVVETLSPEAIQNRIKSLESQKSHFAENADRQIANIKANLEKQTTQIEKDIADLSKIILQ